MIFLVFSHNDEDHCTHFRKVLQLLREHKLCAKLEKCEFFTSRTELLGYIVSSSGISMDPSTVNAHTDWPSPRFIKNFSAIIRPLSMLTRRVILFHGILRKKKLFHR